MFDSTGISRLAGNRTRSARPLEGTASGGALHRSRGGGRLLRRAIGPALCAVLALSAPPVAGAGPGEALVPTTILPHEWDAFTTRFVSDDGRVIDIEKNGVSHSEGQGYGLLLAVRANDRQTFERILDFTMTEMRVRDDGLVSWIWDPRAYPRVIDRNNATDGDVLIAFALIEAAVKWNERAYLRTAMPMVRAIGKDLLRRQDGLVMLRPAAFGFDARHHPDGPVVNLSYYIYGAFLLFREVDGRYPWLEAWQSGLMLTEAAVSRPAGLAPDWVTVRRDRFLAPARGFPARSSYDAVRIPLYMALGGRVPREYFVPFDEAWNIRGNRAPKDYDLEKGRKIMDMKDLGYRAIAALAACVSREVPFPPGVERYRNTTYFSSALHLLTLSAARAHYPHCVEPVPAETILVASSGSRGPDPHFDMNGATPRRPAYRAR